MGNWSLSKRIITLSSLLALLSTGLLAFFLISQYRANAMDGLDSLQQVQLFNVIGAVDLDSEGRLIGQPALGDQRFDEPGSGWYWQAYVASDTNKGNARVSAGLGTPDHVLHPKADAPFDAQFYRTFITDDSSGNQVRVREVELEIGEPSKIVRIAVSSNYSEFNGALAQIRRLVISVLGIFALLLVSLNALLIRVGLRPLDGIRDAVQDIRTGKAERLDGNYPIEIKPLADEVNILIDNNRNVVERARTKVGNLAHALKTPLSVLQNEAASAKTGVKPDIVAAQTAAMKEQVDLYLKRAQIAAQSGGVVFRTPVNETIQRMTRVMAKLKPDLEFELDLPDEELVFSGERQDLEEVAGNLMENAGKWANSFVGVSIRAEHQNEDLNRRLFSLNVEDDGPGIPEEKHEEALKRGRRLDESVHGTGLGLAIVTEIARGYGGDVQLSRSARGGLKVHILLPLAES